MSELREKPCQYEKIDARRCFELAATKRRIGGRTLDLCTHHARIVSAVVEAHALVQESMRSYRAGFN